MPTLREVHIQKKKGCPPSFSRAVRSARKVSESPTLIRETRRGDPTETTRDSVRLYSDRSVGWTKKSIDACQGCSISRAPANVISSSDGSREGERGLDLDGQRRPEACSKHTFSRPVALAASKGERELQLMKEILISVSFFSHCIQAETTHFARITPAQAGTTPISPTHKLGESP